MSPRKLCQLGDNFHCLKWLFSYYDCYYHFVVQSLRVNAHSRMIKVAFETKWVILWHGDGCWRHANVCLLKRASISIVALLCSHIFVIAFIEWIDDQNLPPDRLNRLQNTFVSKSARIWKSHLYWKKRQPDSLQTNFSIFVNFQLLLINGALPLN